MSAHTGGVLAGQTGVVAPTWACLQETKESAFYTSASCLCGQALVIIGGTGREGRYAEVFVYHLNELKWLKGDTTGRGPPTRPLYSSATSRGDNVAVVWSKMHQGRLVVTLSVLSLAEMEWRSVVVDGALNPPRHGYSAVMSADGDVVLFGGEAAADNPTPTDACIVIADDDSTALIPAQECPPPRSDHASCVAPQDSIVVHGGKGVGPDGQHVLLGDMWVYDAARRSWGEVSADGPQRCGHSISCTQSQILLFGGVDWSGTVMNDLWCWDVAEQSWSGPLVVVGTPIPMPRAGHLFSLVWPQLDAEPNGDDACFVLYGGVPGPNAAPLHDVSRLTVPASRQLAVAPNFSEKLAPTSNPLDQQRRTHYDDDEDEIAGAMARLRDESGKLEEQERELLRLEAAKLAKEERLRLDRERLDRERTELAGRVQTVETGVRAYYDAAPPAAAAADDRVLALERQLYEERSRVHALITHLNPNAVGAAHTPTRGGGVVGAPPPFVAQQSALPASLPSPVRHHQYGQAARAGGAVVSPPRPPRPQGASAAASASLYGQPPAHELYRTAPYQTPSLSTPAAPYGVPY